MPIRKLGIVLKGFASDVRGTVTNTADVASGVRLLRDFALARVISLIPASERNRVREVTFTGDTKIRYRLNKGDLQAIKEIWFQECYRPHFGDPVGTLLDLGANIGMSSVWLAKKYPVSQVIAVEPDPRNAAIARQNFEANGLRGQVLEAAIGPQDGTGRFASSDHSILGRLSQEGDPVTVMSIESIKKKFDIKRFALVKIDIEGGEQALLDGPCDWLQLTDAIIVEFHPEVVDYPRLVSQITSCGFRYIPTNSVFMGNADCFVRQERVSRDRQSSDEN
jgi:FkbM family methyltransferase